MPSTAPWARYDPRIRLVINGQNVPCVRCAVDFELNAIPQAAATLALGRTFDGVVSPTHALSTTFINRMPAQIYITPNALGIDPNSAQVPGDLGLIGNEVRIFDGYAVSAGFSRSRGQVQYNIQMEHWLSQLGFSSIFSKTSHPANPGHFSYSALSPADGAGAAWTTLGLAHNFVTSEAVLTDLWGGSSTTLGLKPFFQFLCRQDAFESWDPSIKGQGKNDAALAAINRFNSPYQQKLAVAITSDADVVSNIRDHIGAAIGFPGPLANQTLWDVLIGTLAADYLFTIVPRVEDAIVAPFVPGYRTAFAVITANQETQIEWIRGLGRPLRGVGIQAGASSNAGSTLPGQGTPPLLGIGGYFIPDPNNTNGIIIIKKGPEWMTRLYAPGLYGGTSSGGAGNVISTGVQPGAPKVNDVPNQVNARIKNTIKPFLTKYAQAQYAVEKLRGRQAVCSCPFRLDIAPGSTVLVQNQGEQFIGADPLAAPFYAHVARVSLVVDGETPSIGTSFHLSHIRGVRENTDDRTSVANHPLYKTTFAGCPLVGMAAADVAAAAKATKAAAAAAAAANGVAGMLGAAGPNPS